MGCIAFPNHALQSLVLPFRHCFFPAAAVSQAKLGERFCNQFLPAVTEYSGSRAKRGCFEAVQGELGLCCSGKFPKSPIFPLLLINILITARARLSAVVDG